MLRLLNFAQVPVSTFGRQLAFNLLTQSQLGDRDAELERRIQHDVGEMFGWERPKLALQLVTTPIFYGHGIQLHLKMAPGVTLEALSAALAGHRFADPPTDDAVTPLELAQEARLSIAPPHADGLGGYWLWASAGEVGGRAATHAVRIAQTVADL